MTRISTRVALAGVIVFLAVSSLMAGETGLPPFGSFSGGPFDQVNNANLNVHFAIPFLVKNGRGLPFTYLRRYDSWIWYTHNGNSWSPRYHWGSPGVAEALTG